MNASLLMFKRNQLWNCSRFGLPIAAVMWSISLRPNSAEFDVIAALPHTSC